MKITQKLELSEEERNAIADTITLCENISEKTHRSVIEVFDFLYGEAQTPHNMIDREVDLSEMD